MREPNYNAQGREIAYRVLVWYPESRSWEVTHRTDDLQEAMRDVKEWNRANRRARIEKYEVMTDKRSGAVRVRGTDTHRVRLSPVRGDEFPQEEFERRVRDATAIRVALTNEEKKRVDDNFAELRGQLSFYFGVMTFQNEGFDTGLPKNTERMIAADLIQYMRSKFLEMDRQMKPMVVDAKRII